jgi:hypothetical protein
LADVSDLLADFTNVERIIVSLGLRLSMGDGRVLPGLSMTTRANMINLKILFIAMGHT